MDKAQAKVYTIDLAGLADTLKEVKAPEVGSGDT